MSSPTVWCTPARRDAGVTVTPPAFETGAHWYLAVWDGHDISVARELTRLGARGRVFEKLGLAALDLDDVAANSASAIPGVTLLVAGPGTHAWLPIVEGIEAIIGHIHASDVPASDGYAVIVGDPPKLETDPALQLAGSPPLVAAALNMSLAPHPGYRGGLEDIVNAALGKASESILCVVVAGNDGAVPGRTTTSTWGTQPWMLCVGATDDEVGTTLADYSSRGTAEEPTSGPDLVSWGVSAVAPHPTGTSFAAPRITHAAILATVVILQLRHAWILSETGQRQAIPRVGVGMIDVDKPLQRRFQSVSGWPVYGVNTAAVSELVRAIDTPVNEIALWPSPRALRHLLVTSARPMPGYAQHEVGAGFLDVNIMIERLAALNGSELLSLLGLEPPSVSIGTLDQPLLNLAELEFMAELAPLISPLWFWDYKTSELSGFE